MENTSLFETDSFLSDNERQIGDGGLSRIVIIPYIVCFLQILLATTLAIRDRLEFCLKVIILEILELYSGGFSLQSIDGFIMGQRTGLPRKKLKFLRKKGEV